MDTVTWIQILDKAVCISYNTNAPGKGINPTTLPLAMRKYLGRSRSLTLSWQPVKEKENSEFKSVKLYLEIDLVLHPVCAEGLVNWYRCYAYICTYIHICIYIKENMEK